MRPARRMMRLNIDRGRAVAALVVGAALAASLAGPAASQFQATGEGVRIVVTYSVLGAVVTDLVDDAADVTILMGNGVDPHDWSPSAQDIEAVYGADLVVANGLDLEEGLHDVLQEAEATGVRVFEATDHITVRGLEDGEHGDGHGEEGEHDEGASPWPSASIHSDHEDEEHELGEEHEHGALDPHFWVDPLAMLDVVNALGAVVSDLGVDVSESQPDLVSRLSLLDIEVRMMLEAVPPDRRKLVTGHESMGYFADRYGFALVGAVVPGLSSQGEPSAQELAALVDQVRQHSVPAVLMEIGTPQAVVDAIAGETGVAVVELPSHNLPADGTYETFIRTIAGAIADALS